MKYKALACAVAACTLPVAWMAPALAQELDTEEAKVSYGLGMMIGERILGNYGEIDFDLLMKGMQAQRDGTEPLISMEEAQAALQGQQERLAEEAASAAIEAGDKYREENAARDGVTVTDSGLQYEVLAEGDGAQPALEDTVSVHYVGTLIDGTEFDSSIARGEPASFPLANVIKGWGEGLQLMKVGSKFRFVIPPDIAYGDRGAGQAIGPNETLIFEVELLEIAAK